ncbi:Nitrogen permease regulator 3 [Thecaphora frezii]
MNDPLLAVILATSSSRGSHIVFRWPNHPTVFKRYSKVKYYAENYHSAPAAHSHHKHDQNDLDPVRQKANWDRHDEDHDDDEHDHDQDDQYTDDVGKSDTASSSSEYDQDSDASNSDQGPPTSTRNTNLHDATSVARSRTSAGASRSKSKSRKPLSALDESLHSLRSLDRSPNIHDGSAAANNTHTVATQQPESDAGGTSNHLSPEEKARREERAARAYRTYLGYDTDLLASILSPRQELAHQKFELVIDDLAFLGHPVRVGPRGQWGDSDDVTDKDSDADDQDSNRYNSSRGRSTSASRQVSPTRGRVQPPQSDASSTRSLAPLTQFHLVLVLDRPDPSAALGGMDLSSWLQLFYDHIVFKTTASLFAEQVRADYVAKEAEKLLALRERCMDDGQSYSAYAAQCLGISSLARCMRDLHKSISTSSDAFLTINDRIEVHLQLPPILQHPEKILKVPDVETELDPNDPIFLSGGGFAGMGKEGGDGDEYGGGYDRLMSLGPSELTFEEWTRTTGPYLLPWKTLLLLQDHPDDAAARQRSPRTSPYIGSEAETGPNVNESLGFEQLTRKFTALFRPRYSEMLNFDEVANTLDWDLYDDVYPMVRHLIYYRQARVIDVPRPGHVYGISPLFDFKRLPALCHSWADTFPELPPLAAFLSQISSALRPLSALLPGRYQRQLCLDVLIWLLRQEVVVKLHIRLRLVATQRVKLRAIERRQERLERKRKRKERKQQRLARLEAKQARQAQREERKRELQKQRQSEASRENETEQEQRGRSRDRDRSRSADTRRALLPAEGERTSESVELTRSVSGLSGSRPNTLDEPADAAASAGQDRQESESDAKDGSTSQPSHRSHHHHHHHHHHQQGHHGYDHHANTAMPPVGSQPSAPILISSAISSGQRFETLKFERRPVLRSRSPSTALSVSFSNTVALHRPRAGTSGSASSSGMGVGRIESLSMTPNTSSIGHRSPARSATPRGRRIPRHVRNASTASGPSQGSAGRASQPSSSGGAGLGLGAGTEGTLAAASHSSSVPNTAAVLSKKGRMMSRSPSRARLKITGFGQDEEVEIDGDSESMSMDVAGELADAEEEGVTQTEDDRRLSLVGEEADDDDDGGGGGGDGDAPFLPPIGDENISPTTIKPPATPARRSRGRRWSQKPASTTSASSIHEGLRRISMASERPDFPPSPLASSSEEGGASQDHRCGSDCPADCPHASMSCSSSSSSSECSRSPLTSDLSDFDDEFDDEEGEDQPTKPSQLDTTETLIIEPSRATREENEWISAMVEGKPAWLVKKLFRLLPYLNGKHTIDEIEYRVAMKRKEIRILLAEFREVVVTFMHP